MNIDNGFESFLLFSSSVEWTGDECTVYQQKSSNSTRTQHFEKNKKARAPLILLTTVNSTATIDSRSNSGESAEYKIARNKDAVYGQESKHLIEAPV